MVHEPGGIGLPDNKSSCLSILYLQNWEAHGLLFISHPVFSIFYRAQMELKTAPLTHFSCWLLPEIILLCALIRGQSHSWLNSPDNSPVGFDPSHLESGMGHSDAGPLLFQVYLKGLSFPCGFSTWSLHILTPAKLSDFLHRSSVLPQAHKGLSLEPCRSLGPNWLQC